jgi:hypothetical protein
MLTAAIVPTAAALAIERANVSGWVRALAYVAGALLTVAIYMILLNFLPMRGMRKLEARLQGKLERENASQEIRSGTFVSLAPDPGPRIYEGNWAWDIGFLAASNDGLSYCGEETRFTLRREQITRISRGPGPLGCFNNQSLYVTWRDGDGNERVFNLRPLGGRSMLEMARLTRQLASELENWHRGIPFTTGSLLSGGNAKTQEKGILGNPDFGQVTSFSPRALARGHQLVRIFLFDSFTAVSVAILFGFRFPMLDAIVPSSSTAGLNKAGGAMLYVLVTVWVARAFVLWPFWRFREATSHPGPAIPPPAVEQHL